MTSAKIVAATLCAVVCLVCVSAETSNPMKNIRMVGEGFDGEMDIHSFEAAKTGKGLTAVGLCTGTLTDGSTVTDTPCQSTVSSINGVDPASMPGKRNRKLLQTRTCNIVTLNLSGLFLNVLGVVVLIPAPVVVIINAVAGAGNLLGNLLCAVTNLLNGIGGLNGLINLLNLIVASLTAALG